VSAEISTDAVVVADTGPLIALAGIDGLDLLPQLFGSVLVPDAVHDEMLAGGEGALGLDAYQRAEFLDVREVSRIDPALQALLHRGEASVVALARSVDADLVLIDEQKARKVARGIYGLTVIGSVRVLLEAKRRGFLPSIAEKLDAMRANGYRLHDRIVEAALSEAGE
jgi:predicted nucleic acid-binding protein